MIVQRHRPWFRIFAVVGTRSAERAEQDPRSAPRMVLKEEWSVRCGLGRNNDAIGIKRNVCVVGGYSVHDPGSEYAGRGRERVQTNGPEVPVFTNYDQSEAR